MRAMMPEARASRLAIALSSSFLAFSENGTRTSFSIPCSLIPLRLSLPRRVASRRVVSRRAARRLPPVAFLLTLCLITTRRCVLAPQSLRLTCSRALLLRVTQSQSDAAARVLATLPSPRDSFSRASSSPQSAPFILINSVAPLLPDN